jgi:hypothetical protein
MINSIKLEDSFQFQPGSMEGKLLSTFKIKMITVSSSVFIDISIEINIDMTTEILYIATGAKFNQTRVFTGETHIKYPFNRVSPYTYYFQHSQYTIKLRFDMRLINCFKN